MQYSDYNQNALENKYTLRLPLKPVTVFTDLMAKGRPFQRFGAGYVKERTPIVTLDKCFAKVSQVPNFSNDRMLNENLAS